MARWQDGKIGVCVVILTLMLLAACGEKGRESADRLRGDEVVLATVMDLDSTNLAAFCEAGSVAILEFGGKRCISCMEMRENFEELRKDYPALRIGFVYWEDSPELFETWEIGLIPAQVVLNKDGNEVTRHTGVWEVDEMRAAVRHISSP